MCNQIQLQRQTHPYIYRRWDKMLKTFGYMVLIIDTEFLWWYDKEIPWWLEDNICLAIIKVIPSSSVHALQSNIKGNKRHHICSLFIGESFFNIEERGSDVLFTGHYTSNKSMKWTIDTNDLTFPGKTSFKKPNALQWYPRIGQSVLVWMAFINANLRG